MLAFLLLLVEACDIPLIERLYHQFYVDCFKFASKLLMENKAYRDPSFDANDIAQETYYRLSLYIKKFNAEKSDKEQKYYVLGIARNVFYDFSNKKIFCEALEDISEYEAQYTEQDFFEQLRIRCRYEMVVEEMTKLPAAYRIVLEMKYLEEWSPTKISNELHISRNTVYNTLRRGKAQLIQNLKERGDF